MVITGLTRNQLGRKDGSAGITMPIDDGSLARPSEMLDGRYRPARQSRVTLESSNVAAMSVPGATLLILTPFDDSGLSHPPSLIRLDRKSTS